MLVIPRWERIPLKTENNRVCLLTGDIVSWYYTTCRHSEVQQEQLLTSAMITEQPTEMSFSLNSKPTLRYNAFSV